MPEILVDDGPSALLPPSSSRDITLAGRNSVYITDTPRRPTLQVGTAEARHTRVPSNMSTLSADLGSLSPHRYEQLEAEVRHASHPQFVVAVTPRLPANPLGLVPPINMLYCSRSTHLCGEVSNSNFVFAELR